MFRRLLIVTFLLAAACNRPTPPSDAPAPQAPKQPTPLPMDVTQTGAEDPVLATVNGQPITLADVRLALHLKSEEDEVPDDRLEAVIGTLIRQEVIAQRAAELHLDQLPQYQLGYSKAVAPANAYRRKALGDAFFHKEVEAAITVSDAEAQKYYDEHAELLRAEFRVEQYLTRDRGKANTALKSLRAGASIADVNRADLPGLPADQKPWELGWIHWQTIPEEWQKPLTTLKVGETSDIIASPTRRFWIIKLLERRTAADVDFAKLRPSIVEHLRAKKVEAARVDMGADLFGKAKIVRRKSPLPPPLADPEP